MEITPEVFEIFKKLPVFKGRIMTDSMSPVIRPGEQVTVSVMDKDLKRFDIIVFRQDGKLVCHYLWSMNQIVRPLLLQTKSLDGRRDRPIMPEDYLGKVISHRLSWWRKLRILFFQ